MHYISFSQFQRAFQKHPLYIVNIPVALDLESHNWQSSIALLNMDNNLKNEVDWPIQTIYKPDNTNSYSSLFHLWYVQDMCGTPSGLLASLHV